MITAYDFTMARLLDEGGADMLLVGDSLGMVVQGHPTTLPVTVDEICYHGRAVARGAHHAHVVGDMPFMSFQVSAEKALENAGKLIKDGGFESVKIEGGEEVAEHVRRMVAAGIPVMGHVGLTPQTSTALGGYKAQGRSAAAAEKIARETLALQDAGCFAIVFEAIPAAVAEELMPHVSVPVIGIGAGPATDGQVLVFHDLLGIREGMGARFVKRYASLQEEMNAGVAAYAADVRSHRFPGPEHGYSIDEGELEGFRATLAAA